MPSRRRIRTFRIRNRSNKKVLLGGTTGENKWRDSFIERLGVRGISSNALFNPVVEHWTKDMQEIEDAMKADPNVVKVFFLGDTGTANGIFLSFYSLLEATMGLYDAPNETALYFDYKGLVPRAAKRLAKACADLRKRFPEAPIFESLQELEEWTYAALTR